MISLIISLAAAIVGLVISTKDHKFGIAMILYAIYILLLAVAIPLTQLLESLI